MTKRQSSGGAGCDRPSDERGFTLIEMMIALMLIAIVMTGLLAAVYGGQRALSAAHQRSMMLEEANADIESLRSLPYASVAVQSDDSMFATSYPSGRYLSQDAVVVDPGDVSPAPPAAVTVVTISPLQGIVLPYTIKRYVTWTDPAHGATHAFKQLAVTVSWSEGSIQRNVSNSSLLYPGGLGLTTPFAKPVAGTLSISPTSGSASVTSRTLTDTGSSTPNAGDTLTYTWDFGDGTARQVTSTPSITYTYFAPGTFYPTVTVTDTHSDGDIAIAAGVNVTADATAAAPHASFTLDTNTGVAPLTVNFDGATSNDPNGGTLTYSWNFGDGSAQVAGVSVSHVFATAGTFSTTLTVTDNSAKTNSAAQTVTATPLNCDVRAASFNDPAANTTPNDVKATSGVPQNTLFAFSVTTNDACTSIDAQLFYSDGTAFNVVLAVGSDIAGVKTWGASATSTKSFSVGTGQSADAYDTVAGATLTFSYNVHP